MGGGGGWEGGGAGGGGGWEGGGGVGGSAKVLLDNYKAVIFSKRLIDVLPNLPNKAVKEECYAIIVAKIEKNFHKMTVADLLEFQLQFEEVIMDIKNGVCILDHVVKGCVEVHWYIPISCVDRAYQNAKAKSSQFDDLHLQYVRTGNYPLIPDSPKQANAGKHRFTVLS